jgi:hypothetical protein
VGINAITLASVSHLGMISCFSLDIVLHILAPVNEIKGFNEVL